MNLCIKNVGGKRNNLKVKSTTKKKLMY